MRFSKKQIKVISIVLACAIIIPIILGSMYAIIS